MHALPPHPHTDIIPPNTPSHHLTSPSPTTQGRAYKQKKLAEGMAVSGKPWTVRACLLYTLSGTLYLQLAEYSARLRRSGRSSPNNVSFESTIAFLECAVKLCQNARGNGHVRQALEMLLERLTAMAYMRHFNAEASAVKRSGEKVKSFLKSAQQAQAAQQGGKVADGSAGGQAGKGTSPGDSATSCQDVTALPAEQLTPPAGAVGGLALGLLPPVSRDVTDAQEKVRCGLVPLRGPFTYGAAVHAGCCCGQIFLAAQTAAEGTPAAPCAPALLASRPAPMHMLTC